MVHPSSPAPKNVRKAAPAGRLRSAAVKQGTEGTHLDDGKPLHSPL